MRFSLFEMEFDSILQMLRLTDLELREQIAKIPMKNFRSYRTDLHTFIFRVLSYFRCI